MIVWDVYNEPGPFFDSTRSFPLAKAAMGWVVARVPSVIEVMVPQVTGNTTITQD